MTVRPALLADLPGLAAIERSAAARFAGTPMRWAVEGDTLPVDILRQAQAAGLLWVAEADGQPGGFALAEPMDGSLFLLEMSVALPRQGRGLGSALLAAVIAHARDGGYASVLLTTDRELSWNGPYYRRRGFFELERGRQGPALRARLDEEAAAGFDPARRVAMAHDLRP
ncbi:GNAT family N-acetyltransferase [Achromobacter sp. Marseille-Q0513]|uniref:GNAT family N-acetyltransferase n=1 Tax=Achromobacter sp. Marseille-Q0513 TaxID=2829161 RepID=UPI001B9A7B46|nr:GNAT family N-acetyltransferase [Achromobacter sp. Marseille-Q0513]MBR8656829.1 GNAT family N-acetyltransferase [Achromobacter sp. Marseille-Q0513]